MKKLRDNLVRETTREVECSWCGQTAIYRYGYHGDWRPVSWYHGTFCCIDCFREYHQL